MPVQAFKTNIVEKGRVIIGAENLKNDMALRDSVSHSDVKGYEICDVHRLIISVLNYVLNIVCKSPITTFIGRVNFLYSV